jgi:hypothetical protein
MFSEEKAAMKLCIKVASVAVWLCAVSVANADDATPDFVPDARSAVMIFQKKLKHELMSAMQSGGLKKAVEVCHSRAPEIAEEISKQTGWEIGRASLKTRNEKNAPSDAERAVLGEFEQRKNNGEAISTLEWWQEKEDAIAYMKAIPMKGMCASCHGSNVSPSLKQHINQFYPHDMATGFEVGDIRGAFTLKKHLEALSHEETP